VRYPHLILQEAVDGLLKQISDMAAPGSRICFDALHRDHMDGRVHNRGFSCGVEVILRPSQYHLEVL